MRCRWLVVIACACEGGEAPPAEPASLEAAREAAFARLSRPDVEGPALDLKAEAPAQELGGVSIRFAYATHTMGRRPRAYAEMSIDGAQVTFSGMRDGDQAELVVRGALLVFERLGYERYKVVFAGTNVAAYPDSEEDHIHEYVISDCDVRIRVAAHTAGFHHGDGQTRYMADGIVTLADASGWRGRCGLYTRRVWIEPRPPPEE